MSSFSDRFFNPEAKYRPHPFWSWNDKLEKDMLKFEIEEMKKTGHGGFFMHARDGLRTEYMGDSWFDCINYCADEAAKEGLEAWCYDEKGWPSGSCGGKVPSLGEKYTQKLIRLLPDDGETNGLPYALYGVKNDTCFRLLDTMNFDIARSLLEDGECLMYISVFERDNYIDILNPEVVDKFIETTYEEYEKRCEGRLGNGTLFGFFTDEPQYALCANPFSYILEDEFSGRYGYSLKENLPALFLGRDGNEKVRYDFWKMVNDLFTSSFAGRINEKCRKGGYSFTGHAMMEDNLLCQQHCTAGAMPMYSKMTIPGVDWLGDIPAEDPISKCSCNPVLPLQLGSVAAQFGKEQAISETFAMSGWDITFRKMKYVIDWQFLGGVNLICQHLAGYSLRGYRKNDFPPSMFYQSPWWDEYKTYIDAQSRTGKILAQGKNDPGVLMIHPMHSVWLKYTNNDMNAEEDFDRRFASTALKFYQCHIPYHFGDETLISENGSVDGDRFIIGMCSYHTVVIPELFGLDERTFELLCEFKKNGGRIVCLCPESLKFVNGINRESDIERLISSCDCIKNDRESIIAYFSSSGIKDIIIESNHGEECTLHCTVRYFEEDGRTVYFVLNTDENAGKEVKITLPGNGVAEYDAAEGTEKGVCFESHEGRISFFASFAPMESKIFVICDEYESISKQREDRVVIPLRTFGGEWEIDENSDENCALLEYCDIRQGDTVSENRHIGCIWKSFGFSENEKMPEYVFSFNVSENTELDRIKSFRVCTEVKLPAKIFVNGKEAVLLEGEWFLDRHFSVFDINGLVKTGRNEIVLTDCYHREGDRFEINSPFGNMYLLGDFGVYFDKEMVPSEYSSYVTGDTFFLTNRPKTIKGDDIVPEGHPFFRGRIILNRKLNVTPKNVKYIVKADAPNAAYLRINVNGEKGKLLSWGTFEDDITSRLREKDNVISAELMIGNRNLLGPHHCREGEDAGPGPESFWPAEPSKWKKRYRFVKAGL